MKYTNETEGEVILPFVTDADGKVVVLGHGESHEVPDPPDPLPTDEELAAMKVKDLHEYVKEHPAELERVLGVESANQQRPSVLALAEKGDEQ